MILHLWLGRLGAEVIPNKQSFPALTMKVHRVLAGTFAVINQKEEL